MTSRRRNVVNRTPPSVSLTSDHKSSNLTGWCAHGVLAIVVHSVSTRSNFATRETPAPEMQCSKARSESHELGQLTGEVDKSQGVQIFHDVTLIGVGNGRSSGKILRMTNVRLVGTGSRLPCVCTNCWPKRWGGVAVWRGNELPETAAILVLVRKL